MSQETLMKTQEEEDLDYARSLRKAFIASMVKDRAAPDDRGDKAILLTALKDIDSAALSRMRIKADEKIGQDGAENAAMIAEVLKQVSSKMGISPVPVKRDKPVSLPQDIPDPDIKPGETEIGNTNSNFNDFMSMMKPDVDAVEVAKPKRRD